MRWVAAAFFAVAVLCGSWFVSSGFAVGPMFLAAAFLVGSFMAFLLSFAGDN